MAAEAELERATAELENLERSLGLARERVERTARSQLKPSSRGALKDATSQLAGTLADGEEVLHMAAGGWRDGRQLIAATDRRLLVFDTTDAPPQAVPYETIESARVGRRRSVEVSTQDGELQFESVVGDLTALVQHVTQRISPAEQRTLRAATPSPKPMRLPAGQGRSGEEEEPDQEDESG